MIGRKSLECVPHRPPSTKRRFRRIGHSWTMDSKVRRRHLDPVCRMLLGPAEVRATRTHAGTILHFCAADCAAAFDLAPETYLPIVAES